MILPLPFRGFVVSVYQRILWPYSKGVVYTWGVPRETYNPLIITPLSVAKVLKSIDIRKLFMLILSRMY